MNDYIFIGKDINLKTIDINSRLIIYVSEDKFNPKYYTQLYVAEYNKISSYYKLHKKHKESSSNERIVAMNRLLQILCYIRFRIKKRSDNQVKHYGKAKLPEVFYHYLLDIGKEIGTTEKTISVAINTLKNELAILYYERLPKYEDEHGNWHTNKTIFTNYYEPNEFKYIFGWKKVS